MARSCVTSSRRSSASPVIVRRTAWGAPSSWPVRSIDARTEGLAGAAGADAAGSGEGRPAMRSSSGPASVMAGARSSSRDGSTASRRPCSSSTVPRHSAFSCTRPALRVASASSASARTSSSRSGWASEPLRSAVSLATGTRCWFQRPGSALLSAMRATAGASRALMRSVASPLRRVRGACACRAERSRSRVLSASASRGQASSSRSAAVSSAVGAGRPAVALPCSVAFSAVLRALPPSASRAVQGGSVLPGAGASVACRSSGSGARVPMRPASAACTPATVAARRPMRCSPPGLGSSRSCSSASSVATGWSSISSRPMRACARLRSSGKAMLSGSGIGRGPGGPVFTTMRSMRRFSMARPAQLMSLGRQRQPMPSISIFSSTALARPLSHSTRRLSACQRPPSSAPCQPCTVRPGTCCSSQRVPASRISSVCNAAAASTTTSSAKPSTQARGTMSEAAVVKGRARPLAAAAAGEGPRAAPLASGACAAGVPGSMLTGRL